MLSFNGAVTTFYFLTSRFWYGVLFVHMTAIAGTNAKRIASRSSGFLSPSEMEMMLGLVSTRQIKGMLGLMP